MAYQYDRRRFNEDDRAARQPWRRKTMKSPSVWRALRRERQRSLGAALFGILLPVLVLVSDGGNRAFGPATLGSTSHVQGETALAPDVLVLDLLGLGMMDYSEVDDYLNAVPLPGRNSFLVPLFDIDADGAVEMTGWLLRASEEAFLWLDGNNNREVDGAQEFFGPASIGPWGDTFAAANGFEVLAQYDRHAYGGNGDGRIDRQDDVWRRLRLWGDLNFDGQSQPDEIQRLSQRRIDRIDLDYVETGERERRMDNQRVARGTFWLRDLRRQLREREVVAIRFRFAELQ